MMTPQTIRKTITLATATGVIGHDAGNSMLSVIAGSSLLRQTRSLDLSSRRRVRITHTLDSEGNLLVAGREYLYKNNVVTVLREKPGQGNISDVYQNVFFLSHHNCVRFIEVQGHGVVTGAVFRSPFSPIGKPKK